MSYFRPNKTTMIINQMIVGFVFLLITGEKNKFITTETLVGGPIYTNTTWTEAASPYIVIDNIDVLKDITLMIEPGVVVKLETQKKIEVNGQFIARGTFEKPIKFTSNKTTPAPGDWGNIEFTTTSITTTLDSNGSYISGSVLQYCEIDYGGYNSSGVIIGSGLLIDNCVIQRNSARGIDMDPYNIRGSSRITNNIFSENISSVPTQWRNAFVGGNIIKNNSYTGMNSSETMVYSILYNNQIIGNIGNYTVGGVLASSSTVISNTIKENRGFYGGGIFAQSSSVINNYIEDNISKKLGGGIYLNAGEMISNTIKGNRTEAEPYWDNTGGGVYAAFSKLGHNLIIENHSPYQGGGVYAYNSTVTQNIISNISAVHQGGGIYATNSNVISNTVSENSLIAEGDSTPSNGTGIYFIGSGNLISNAIVGNNSDNETIIGGIGIESHSLPNIHLNTIYGNFPYNVKVEGSDDIDGIENYWGTTNSVEISLSIFDWYDDSIRGKFLIIPFLPEPSNKTPIPPPLDLTIEKLNPNTINISWEPVRFNSTSLQYKLFYDTDNGIPPYDGTGLTEGDSPINTGDQSSIELSDLNQCANYYFAVTVSNGQDKESGYSKSVNLINFCNYLPLITK